jgi:Iap family predicted aminopeptidase
VGILASDSLEGRRTGTAGEEKAVSYIESYYRALGIAGAAPGGSYRQPFVVDEGKVLASTAACMLDEQLLKAGAEFVMMPWSAVQSIDASTSVPLLEQGSPWWYDVKDDLEANKNNQHLLPEQMIREKAIDAASKGATALLVYNSGNADDGIKFNGKDRTDAVKIPVIYFTKAAVAKFQIQATSNFHVKASIAFTEKKRNGINVAALINNNAAQTIILGAHLDHLGYGEDENSRHTGPMAIHNGADDNASGTAALMELGRLLKTKKLPYNILLLHFSGEELGLYGSKYFTDNPLIDLKQANYMINMDMVGRLNDSSKSLTIGGIGTSPAWPALLKLNEQKTFAIKVDSSGTGPSDHTSFYRKDLPVLFFFTGLHTDYHKPSDDAATINYKGEASIVHYIASIVESTPANDKLVFTKTREQQMGTGGRFKVSIGIMPDYTFSGQGVRADGIIDGRPAQKAGVMAGDVIIQLGEYLVTSVETYMQCLNRFEKGQSSTVTVRRGKEVKEFPISF